MNEDEILNLINQSNIDEASRKKISNYLKKSNDDSDSTNENFIIHLPGFTGLGKTGIIHYKGKLKKGREWETYLNQGIVILDDNSDIEIGTSSSYIKSSKNEGILICPTIKISDSESSKNEEIIGSSYNEILELKNIIETLNDSVNKLQEENTLIKELFYNDATSFNDIKTTQKLPIEIYLDTNEPKVIFKLYESVLDFAKSIGFDKSLDFEAVRGSWFKRLIALSSEKLSNEEVKNRLKEAEYGIEVNTILKQQSEIDKNQSEALANIITSLKDIPNAAIRIGALIVVKVTDSEGTVNLQTRTLSIKELHLLNKKT